ncbi:ribonuclease H-like domain-containing protein [Tanacetum coccineum]
MKNPYLIYNICGGAHEDDECDQVESREKKEEEEGPDWVVRSKFKDEMANFMMEKKKQKNDNEQEKFLSIFKHININLSFLEALDQMPKGAKVLKDLLFNKAKLENDASSVTLSEECSTAIQKTLPQKKGDLGSFTLPCLIGTMPVKNALADLGASINLMPHSLLLKLGISKLKPTKMRCIGLNYPGTTIPCHGPRSHRVHDGKLSLRVGKERVTFNIGKSMKFASSQDDCLYFVDHTDEMVQEHLAGTLDPDRNWIDNEEEDKAEEVQAISFYLRKEPVEPLEWKILENRLKPSVDRPLKVELKALPDHLDYAFLQADEQLLVVISSSLSALEKVNS